MEDQKKKTVDPEAEVDSCISLTFDSASEVSREEESGKLEVFDSGLVADCEPPPTTKVQIEDIFAQDKDGDTLLHLAAAESGSDVLFPLIRLAPHPDCLDLTNNLFQSVLHVAALTGQSSVVRRLVVAGATLDLADHGGNTPLHLASRRGDLDCVLAMLRPPAPEEIAEARCRYPLVVQPVNLSVLINAKNYDGQTCVHLAAAGGFSRVMECLHAHGADVNHQEGKTGRTALHYAVEVGSAPLLDLLLRRCGADPLVPNYAGRLPLAPHAFSEDEDEGEELFNSLTNSRSS